MERNGHSRVVWIEDQPEGLRPLIQGLEDLAAIKVDVVTDGWEASHAIKDDPPDALIVDLLLQPNRDSGLDTAITVKTVHPSMPIVAVTEHLPAFYGEVAASLVESQYPFERIWEKDQLRSTQAVAEFVSIISSLCHRERHSGTVIEMQSDYCRVELETLSGDRYERFFETPFVKACGVTQAGDEIVLVFSKSADEFKGGKVCMHVIRRWPPNDALDQQVKQIQDLVAEVDMDRIRKKFGNAMQDE